MDTAGRRWKQTLQGVMIVIVELNQAIYISIPSQVLTQSAAREPLIRHTAYAPQRGPKRRDIMPSNHGSCHLRSAPSPSQHGHFLSRHRRSGIRIMQLAFTAGGPCSQVSRSAPFTKVCIVEVVNHPRHPSPLCDARSLTQDAGEANSECL